MKTKFLNPSLFLFALSIIFICFLMFIPVKSVLATNSSSTSNGSLTIWDTTESSGRYTFGTTNDKNPDYWNVRFYANYTNGTGQNITDGNCSFRFKENLTGYTGWQQSTYNESSGFYEYNRSFNYKGNITWQANCTSSYENFTLTDYTGILNSPPEVTAKFMGKLPEQNYVEDTVENYDFSINCTEDDYNDLSSLIYGINNINNDTASNYPWFSINLNTGILTINASRDNESGSFNVDLRISDSEPTTDSATLPIMIIPVNDAPQINNLDEFMNATENINYDLTIDATDEEDNTPFYYDVSFINCTTARWSPRDSTNCTLFSINETTGWINFTPDNNDVGVYTINFTVRDSGQTVEPYNAFSSQLVIFEVINVNNPPELDYVCDNERNATEDHSFSCLINATDIDEDSNLTFHSNYSWFKFNNSENSITVNFSEGVSTAQVNFTPDDSAVGNWSVNITVEDSFGGLGLEVINFFVNNTPDNPTLLDIEDQEAFVGAIFTLYVNASDDDLLITDKNVYNENITFTSNATELFNITLLNSSGNISIGLINFTPSDVDIGNHTIRVNITDQTGNSDYKLFALTIWNNSGPVWSNDTPTNQTATEDSAFFLNLSPYVYDPDNDSITFSSNASSEFPSFNLTSDGIINFTANDSDVGVHAILITVRDNKTTSASKMFNFTVNNINDDPYITPINDIGTSQENETIFYIYAYDNDLIINDSVYNETLSFNKTITNLTGSYRDLFNITVLSTVYNLTTAIVNFTPNRSDVGNYTINITVTDTSNLSAYVVFDISILEINHAPRMSISNYAAGINNNFLQYIVAVDVDNDSITFTDNSTLFNISSVNETRSGDITTAYAVINFTPNSSNAGIYYIQVNATDEENATNSSVFRLKIYNAPYISYFDCSRGTSGRPLLYEGSSSLCMIDAIQTIEESMNYNWFLDSISVQNDSGRDTKIWTYQPNFLSEGQHNLTVFVSNEYFTSRNSSTISVNHANAPPKFSGTIGNITVGGSSTSINLLTYFSDIDYYDKNYNQSINFTWEQYDLDINLTVQGINISQENYTLTLESSINTSVYVLITAIDSDNSSLNVSSNYFLVDFTVEEEQQQEIRSSGGGSSTQTKIVSINVLVPEPITMYSIEEIRVPLKLVNDGDVTLNNINLSAYTKRKNVFLELNQTYFNSLGVGESESIQLIIKTNAMEVRDLESFEIDVSAQVSSPAVNDSVKILVNMLENNRALRLRSEEKNNFLNEFIASNPECLELKEILNQAEEAFKNADYNKSMELSEKAIQACKSLVNGREPNNILNKIKSGNNFYIYLIILLVIIVLLAAFSVYYNKKRSNVR